MSRRSSPSVRRSVTLAQVCDGSHAVGLGGRTVSRVAQHCGVSVAGDWSAERNARLLKRVEVTTDGRVNEEEVGKQWVGRPVAVWAGDGKERVGPLRSSLGWGEPFRRCGSCVWCGAAEHPQN